MADEGRKRGTVLSRLPAVASAWLGLSAVAWPGGFGATAFAVCGELAAQAPRVTVRYPERNQRLVPDSNFVFGAVAPETASLRVNGVPVPVEPGGGFLAWLPVPSSERGDTAYYRFSARGGGDSAEVRLPVLRPRTAPPAGARSPWFDAAPLQRQPERWMRPGETLPVDVVGEAGLRVWLEAGELRVELEDEGAVRGSLHRYRGELDAAQAVEAACRAGDCRAGVSDSAAGPRAPSPESRGGARAPSGARVKVPRIPIDTALVTVRARALGSAVGGRAGEREARASFRVPIGVLEGAPIPAPGDRAREPLSVRLLEAEDPVNGESGVVVGRPTPYGPYRWRFPDGTVAPVTGREGSRLRIALGPELEAWVLAEDAVWLPGVDAGDPARAWDARMESEEEGVSFRIGLSRAVPIDVETTGPSSLAILLYDTHGEITRMAHGTGTGVASMRWRQEPGPSLRIELELDWRMWGHRASFEPGDARAYEGPGSRDRASSAESDGVVLRVRIRRPPPVRPEAPLEGRVIAVDPGHPGGGSYGPTGLYEADANLAIALELVDLLEAAGAEPLLIRPDREAMGLYQRTRRAREAGADLFVSIHNNALPDGVRPFERAGTGTYYYHVHSAALARAVQAGMVAELGLPDLGVLWGDLAVAREPWMPAVLTEGAFMMIPAHEAALRTPEFRRRYARGVLEGVRAFLAEHAGGPP